MNTKRFLLIIMLCLSAGIAQAQSAKSSLTNANIIKLVKGGLESDIIITTIESSPGKYDVTPDALVSLKSAGVPSPVIKSMMTKMDEEKSKGGGGTSPSSGPSTGRVPEPESLNAIYAYNKASKSLKSLEKANAVLKTHIKAFGYGGTTNACEITGEKSGTRLKPDEAVSFVINTGGASPDAIRLLKLDSKKKVRSATLSKVSGLAKATGVQGNFPCQIKVLKPGVYEIVPESKLDKGEYFFTIKQIEYTTMSNLDVYAFGID